MCAVGVFPKIAAVYPEPLRVAVLASMGAPIPVNAQLPVRKDRKREKDDPLYKCFREFVLALLSPFIAGLVVLGFAIVFAEAAEKGERSGLPLAQRALLDALACWAADETVSDSTRVGGSL